MRYPSFSRIQRVYNAVKRVGEKAELSTTNNGSTGWCKWWWWERYFEPWFELADWPVEDEQQMVRIFAIYRQRWAVEDSFQVTEECLGWEVVKCWICAASAPWWLWLGSRQVFFISWE